MPQFTLASTASSPQTNSLYRVGVRDDVVNNVWNYSWDRAEEEPCSSIARQSQFTIQRGITLEKGVRGEHVEMIRTRSQRGDGDTQSFRRESIVVYGTTVALRDAHDPVALGVRLTTLRISGHCHTESSS
ncbi:hypothetical protein Tco_0629767 [Tanacetum coccineum]|uniref:Uncharacterized protein n=1 Tax=Tanacetum coccineum TaxID=301880 RepID=A0ABQ4WU64_9ASTR